MQLCDAGLELQDAFGRRSAILAAREFEQACDVALQLRSQCHVARIVRQVVLAIGHAEATLRQACDVARGLTAILTDIGVDRRGDAETLRTAKVTEHVSRALQRVDATEFRGERLEAPRLNPRRIHVGG